MPDLNCRCVAGHTSPVYLLHDQPKRKGLGIGRLFEPVWQLQPDRERFIPVMESYWKTYPPVYLYYPKNAGKTKRVKALIDFLISTTGG